MNVITGKDYRDPRGNNFSVANSYVKEKREISAGQMRRNLKLRQLDSRISFAIKCRARAPPH